MLIDIDFMYHLCMYKHMYVSFMYKKIYLYINSSLYILRYIWIFTYTYAYTYIHIHIYIYFYFSKHGSDSEFPMSFF